MAKRGQITQAVIDKAKSLGFDKFTVKELRLLPYIQWVMMNSQRIEPVKINQEEREILSAWRAKGWIEGGAAGMSITREFWDAMNEILWLSYVAHEAQEGA